MLLCSCTSWRIIDSHQGGPASQKDFDPSTDAISVTFAVLFLLLLLREDMVVVWAANKICSYSDFSENPYLMAILFFI